MAAPAPQPRKRSDIKVAGFAAGIAFTMLGASFAAVPLYDWFCRTTGFGGTTMVAKEAPKKTGVREIIVRFDANVTGNLGWKFTPEVASIKLIPGEVKTVYYKLTNITDRDSIGVASYGVTPERTGGFFSKIQCFCFTDQTLKAGESRDEAVVFFIDPDLEKDQDLKHINTITLSYTFFPSKTLPKPLAALSSESRVVAQ
ncbi:MAG: cytochrome c oxidase assembly protein [Beijerinckiaceae bacterium]